MVGVVAVGVTSVGDPVRDGQYWIAQLGLEQAWQQSTGAGVTVGVVDTGVNGDHLDLTGAVLPGKAFPALEDGTRDVLGHGTTIAVLVAGRGHGEGAGTLGVAPQAMVLPAKFTGGASNANDAIVWAVDNGAKVINLSLGDDAGRDSARAYDAGLRYAQQHDVIMVAAAGNATDTRVVSPANRPGVIAVSAVDSAGWFRSDVSVAGPEVTLAAPGVDIVTLTGTKVSRGNGTSYAAAIVSGVAALVRAKFPQLDAAAITRRLTSTAKKAAGGDRDSRYGFGVVDPVAALGAVDEPGQDTRRAGWVLPVAIAGSVAAVAGLSWWTVSSTRLRRANRRGRSAARRR